uniref:cytochrome c oxidase subunit II n=1 Tax=Neoseiulus chebalingensis TaxID=3061192 RepID=UPI0030FEB2D5
MLDMPLWGDFYFMNASAPLMEQMLFFHDHSMIIIIGMTIFLLMSILFMSITKKLSMGLMENQFIENVWTLIPMLFLLFIALPSLRLLYLMEEGFSPILTVKITGHQWYWSYEYSEFGVSFDSFMQKSDGFRLLETDAYLSLPVSVLVRFLISSADVIHSWAVQSLSVKVDAIPGRLNQINVYLSRPGFYYGQCSEICGMNHSFMPISIKAMSLGNFLSLF